MPGFAHLVPPIPLRSFPELLELPRSARLPSNVQKFQQLRPTGKEGPGSVGAEFVLLASFFITTAKKTGKCFPT